MSMHQMAAENRQMVVAHCLVCGARNAKQHYGSWCCNGCKGFFWRTVSSKRRYICLNSGRGVGSALDKCEIQDGRRNSCRACRLMRCLDVGMDPNLIRDSWGKSTALKKQASVFGEDKDQPKQPKQQSAISIPSPLLLNNKTQQLGLHQANSENNSPQQQWREMSPSNCSLHSQCSHNSPTPPHLLHQQDIGKGGTENVQLLTDYLEWIQTIAELELFSEQDKNLLILNRARPSGWFILANNFFNKTHQEQTTVGRGKMEVLQSEIVEPLRELLVNKLEFELLRLISFFSTVPQLSEDGKRLVQQLQGKYVCSLSEFALKQCLPLPTCPSPAASLSSGVLRVNRIIHLLSTIEKIAHQYD